MADTLFVLPDRESEVVAGTEFQNVCETHLSAQTSQLIGPVTK